MNRKILVAIFLVSGMAGLVYEVVWVRMLTLVFGATTYAVSTVLFSYMAGLALGSYFFGKKIDFVRTPLRIYGLLELGIGLYALLVPSIIALVNDAYVSMFSEDIPNFLTYSLLRFLLATSVLLVPTTLMGGTLPVLSRYFVRGMGTLGWDVGVLYTINTFGAVLGVFLAGFYLEGTFGVRASIGIAAAANIIIGLSCLYMSRGKEFSLREGRSAQVERAAAPSSPVARVNHGIDPRVVLGVFAISGFCALGYEVIWFRALLLAVYNNTYAFTIMLGTFLTGLAIGSYLASRVIDSKRQWVAIFAYIEISIGVVAAIVVPLFIVLQNTRLIWLRSYLGGSLQEVTIAAFILAFIMMFGPTLLFGATLPVANKIYISSVGDVGKRVGWLYAANTVGALLGSFAVGFLLIPFMGIVRTNVALAVLNLLAGAVVLYGARDYSRRRKWLSYVSVLGFAAVIVVAFMGTGRLSRLHIDMVKDADTVFYKEGAASTVSIVDIGGSRAAFVNGTLVVGSTGGALQTVRMLAHLPMLLHPDPQEVLVIGFGMGVTTHSLSLYKPRRLDVVEIAPEVLAGAPFFRRLNHDVVDDPDLHIVIEDGRNYLLRTRRHPDVVTADPTHPILGSGSLYTRDHYEQTYSRLSANGVMGQYMPLHLLGTREFKSVMATFASVFEHCSLWYSLTDLVLVGSKQPLTIDYGGLEAVMARPSIQRDLELSNLGEPLRLLSHFLLGENEIRAYSQGAPINTDDHPIVEFHGAKSIGTDMRPINLESLRPYVASVKKYVDLSRVSPAERADVVTKLDAIERGKPDLIEGMTSEYRREPRMALTQYQAALAAYEDFPDVVERVRALRSRQRK